MIRDCDVVNSRLELKRSKSTGTGGDQAKCDIQVTMILSVVTKAILFSITFTHLEPSACH